MEKQLQKFQKMSLVGWAEHDKFKSYRHFVRETHDFSD